MPFQQEYHEDVEHAVKQLAQRPIQLALAFFGLALFCVSPASAQQNNSGGHAAPTSVVTPRTRAITPPTGAAHNITTNHTNSHNNNNNPNHNPQRNGYYPYGYVYGVPYAVDNSDASNAVDDSDADCQAGPTIFDRCGSGPAAPPAAASSAYNAQDAGPSPYQQAVYADPAPDSAPASSTPTTLIFKDGHQIEVDNYAIVGQSLYDLTPGHHRKIALADLDIPATQKQNDDSGNSFELPTSTQAN